MNVVKRFMAGLSYGLTSMRYGAGLVRESFAGAWQKNMEIDTRDNILRVSAVYGCITGIASDIAKLHLDVMVSSGDNGIKLKKRAGKYVDLLKKPNPLQTGFHFISLCVFSKLITGNTYIFKQRDKNGSVARLYVLDPSMVTVLVTDYGDVYYQIKRDNISGVLEDLTVPSSEVIHDKINTIFHPLVGISPLYACSMSATLSNKIQNSSGTFFENRSMPSGILTAPHKIGDETAKRIQNHWKSEYSGDKAGTIAVLGDGIKFERMAVTANESQLMDQLNFTVQDIARAFKYPLYKLQAADVKSTNAEDLNLQYYTDCLQPVIESLEAVLNDGLELPLSHEVQFDVDGLIRMNTEARYRTAGESLKVASINEARAKLNLPPVTGGESVYTQQQYYALSDLVELRTLEFEQMRAAQNQKSGSQGSESEPLEKVEEVGAEEVNKAVLYDFRKSLGL